MADGVEDGFTEAVFFVVVGGTWRDGGGGEPVFGDAVAGGEHADVTAMGGGWVEGDGADDVAAFDEGEVGRGVGIGGVDLKGEAAQDEGGVVGIAQFGEVFFGKARHGDPAFRVERGKSDFLKQGIGGGVSDFENEVASGVVEHGVFLRER